MNGLLFFMLRFGSRTCRFLILFAEFVSWPERRFLLLYNITIDAEDQQENSGWVNEGERLTSMMRLMYEFLK